ncbi:predicted protein [Streptomyces sp. C]|nr:predicted protein [Streptomyces sp. C]
MPPHGPARLRIRANAGSGLLDHDYLEEQSGDLRCQACTVGRTTISLTSTPSGCSMA